MINPSINGWIEKFFLEQKVNNNNNTTDETSFYTNTRKTGFIFGYITSFDTEIPIDTSNWLSIEISKVAFLNTLYKVYNLNNPNSDSKIFISKTIDFYDKLNAKRFNFFVKLLPKNSEANHLEEIINNRVQTNGNFLNKSFSHLLTNALLFIDVLAFNQFLINDFITEKYLKKIEETIMSIGSIALNIKNNKSHHDDLLIKLFEASVRFTKFSDINFQSLELLNLNSFTSDLEKKYFIDLAGLTIWSDGLVENNEAYFLYKLAEIMNISEAFVSESIIETNDFILKNRKQIPYFNHSNPVKSFYDNTTNYVVKLIVRNKHRLTKEIFQSKELMLLLAKSTLKDLDAKEKKKVKSQLLDICKTIPTLTIFLIPGGSLLLPLLIKFIPQLLPSSFNENLEEE